MKSSVWLVVFAGLASAPAAFCDQINVGDIFFIDNGNGTTQFYLDNFTGPNDGCSTPGGFPVCDDLELSGALSYSYQSGPDVVTGSATLADPIAPDDQNGNASYAPSSFLLPTSGADILTATFSGSLTPVDFATDAGPFDSDGTVLSADVAAGGGFAVLYATSASFKLYSQAKLGMMREAVTRLDRQANERGILSTERAG